MRGINETTPIADTYCSGLGAIEDLGSALRFYFYVLQEPDDGGPQQRVLVEKLILPKSAVPDGIMQAIAALGGTLRHSVRLIGECVH